MTTVRIDLPEPLAQEARRAGLLTPEAIERLLRAAIERRRAVDQLFDAMDRMAGVTEPPLSPEQIADELKAMRAERRSA